MWHSLSPCCEVWMMMKEERHDNMISLTWALQALSWIWQPTFWKLLSFSSPRPLALSLVHRCCLSSFPPCTLLLLLRGKVSNRYSPILFFQFDEIVLELAVTIERRDKKDEWLLNHSFCSEDVWLLARSCTHSNLIQSWCIDQTYFVRWSEGSTPKGAWQIKRYWGQTWIHKVVLWPGILRWRDFGCVQFEDGDKIVPLRLIWNIDTTKDQTRFQDETSQGRRRGLVT